LKDQENVKLNWFLLLALVFVGKVTGLGRELSLSFVYGASSITDSFYLASSLSSLLFAAVLFSIPSIVVPLYSRMKEKPSGKILLGVLLSFLLVSFFISSMACFFSSEFLGYFSQSSNEINSDAAIFLKVMSFTFMFSASVAFLNALQVVEGMRLPSYIVPVVNNLVFIAAVFVFSKEGGVLYVVWSGVLAWFLLLFFNVTYMKTNNMFLYSWNKRAVAPGKSLLFVFIPLVLSFYAEQANVYVMTYFASGLHEGGVSYVNYANKLNMMAVTVFVIILTTHIFPRLSSLAELKKIDSISNLTTRFLRVLLLLGAPTVVLMSCFSKEIVELLFFRGEFSKDSVVEVSDILNVLILTVPVLLFKDYLMRVFFAFNNSAYPLIALLISMLVHAGCAYLFLPLWGGGGIGAAYLTSCIVYVLLLCFGVFKLYKIQLTNGLGGVVGRILLSLIFMLSVVFMLRENTSVHWVWAALLGAVGYWGAVCIIGVKEAKGMNLFLISYLNTLVNK